MVLDDFLSHVARTPEAVAVQDGARRLTYVELARRASGLADRLVRQGIGPEDVVAVYLDRSAELVVAELAVLFTGAAYLPLDPANPPARTAELLSLAGAATVVDANVVNADELASAGVPLGGFRVAWERPHSSALAYMIFTSGSTGRPKGVGLTHAGLANIMRWRASAYPLGPHCRQTLLCSPGFDASVWETWPTLAAGGTLVVTPAHVRTSPPDLVAWLAEEQITTTFLTTRLAEATLDEQWPDHTTLRTLFTGGAALQRGVPPGLPFTFVNLYGPTETTIAVTQTAVRPDDPVPPTIGTPIDGARCYVLNGLDPAPDGEPGELCLGGPCVGRGYLGEPGHTAKSFVPDLEVPGERMYRTGDKVRRLADGSFEYLGRFDDQVKIRGFRIGPDEVAAALREHPAVRESFVAVDRSGPADPRLISYVAADTTPAELIQFAKSRLPEHMVPAAIVVLPALPMMPNGKVDRTALPAPDRVAAGLTEVVAAQRTATEGAVAGIMSRLLGGMQVGADDDFYALGGSSLVVGRLASQIASELGVTVSLADLLRGRTVAAIAAIVDSMADERKGQPAPATGAGSRPLPPPRPPIGPARRDQPIPLSLQQERVWFFEQLSPGNLAYNTQATVSLRGEVDADVLRQALDEIVRRHEILRTAFVTVDGVATQRPVPTAKAPLRVLDVPAELTLEAIAAQLREPFDLTNPPLARWALLRHGGGENTFVHVEHHFVHDGWSFALLLSELTALYEAFAAGRPSPLREPSLQYADYAVWQRDWLRGEVLKAHVDHWTSVLDGAPDVLELPADRPRPSMFSMRGAAPRIKVPAELSRALRAFSREHRVSLFCTMYAGFAALLYRYTGQQDMLVGTGAAGRSLPELEQLLGMIVNTVPLRTKVSGDMSFMDLLDQVQRTVAEALSWSDTPVDAVINALSTTRDPSRTPLFQVMFSFHDSAVPDLDFGGLRGEVTERSNGSAKCDLNVIVVPRAAQRLGREPRPEDDDLVLVWEHATDLFDASTMARMIEHFLNLLNDAVSHPEAQIDRLAVVAGDEANRIETWSRSSSTASYPADATIPALFADQVAASPDAPAVVFEGASMTYAELDRASNALAWLLRRSGVGTDEPVAVAIERGPDLVVALLAVLKAGGAYLPIDSGSPAPRVAAMIAAAQARFVLVTGTSAAALPELDGVELIRVDAEPALPADERTAPADLAHPLSLAYISFTSGSTGVPKGVAVPQRAVVRLISEPTFAPLGPGERLLHLAPVAFDASTLEIWGALLTGATIVIAPPGPLGLSDVASLLRSAEVTVVWLTAGLFHQLVETDIDALANVPVVLSGGDALNPDAVRAVLAVRRGKPLVNGYGPTENTTFTACHVMTDPGQVGQTVPIGQPIQHTTVYILDPQGRPTPTGVTGELFTGGDGLARGYAKNPAATARSFVPNPFGTGTRLYRTGDLARWRADGTLEFVGRVDDQVKIRGFRVEPGEVAAVLRTHPWVRESVVLVAGKGAQRHLIAYVTPADGVDVEALRPPLLREFLASRLPEYLVPNGFKAVERFPLNANGKVDRAALPAPDRETQGPVTPPQGPTEERLAEIWRMLLPPDGPRGAEIGREDGFFALGGNSLLAARLMFRVREVFDVDLRLASFYETPTLAASAAAIDTAVEAASQGAQRPAPARTIGRRDRSAYRVAEAPKLPTPHVVRLNDDWALWRSVCLRGAGFPIELLRALGDERLAALADAVAGVGNADTATDAAAERGHAGDEQAYAAEFSAEFSAAVGRLSAALHGAAALPEVREAIAWQNRHALTTGVDPLLRQGSAPSKRNAQTRQHEALVASYLQRYCAKNDTIGFFGPVGWSHLGDESGIRIMHAAHPLAARVTYLEGWAVRAIMADHTNALRPWLVPRRMPFVGVQDGQLRLPLTPPIPLTAAEAAVMRACDGKRDATEVAAVVLADPASGLIDAGEVFSVLARLADNRRLAWQVDVAPQDIRPERSLRATLSRVTDDGVRESAEKALAELTSARDELARTGGDVDRVSAAMAGLEATFTRLAGVPPTRRAGELYAGRTLVYEECLRGDTVHFGANTLDGIRDALGLVLDSARWFTASCAAIYAKHFEDAFHQRGAQIVPFADVWLMVNDALFRQPPQLIEPVIGALRQRWSAILDLPADARRVQLRAADLRARVASAFPWQRPPWPTAVHHSPDLMIAGADAANGGRLTWVLGEVHPSIISSRYATWLEFHDDAEALRALAREDHGAPVVWLAETAEEGGTCTRLSNVLASPGDIRLVFAHDSCGYDETLAIGDCDLISSPTGLRVRKRDGSFERGLLDVMGDLISGAIGNSFDVVPPGSHTPRVTIDDLVVSRERWTFAAADIDFATIADESARYLSARAWAASLGLPRHVFARFTGERKPIYGDLTSLASIDLLARSVRRSRRFAKDAKVTVVEMLPSPEDAWLTDARGRRYVSEVRLVAVDKKTQEG